MTLEETAKNIVQASRNRRYIAVYLGIWFILEYLQLVASSRNIMFSLLRTPMMVVTPILLFYLVRYQRKRFFTDGFSRLQGFLYSLELMFYAGLLESFFCLVLNKWIMPDNLSRMYEGMMAQYQELGEMLKNSPYSSLTSIYSSSLESLKDAPIETPINAAINLLSSDMLYGFFWGIVIAFVLKRKPHKEEDLKRQSN